MKTILLSMFLVSFFTGFALKAQEKTTVTGQVTSIEDGTGLPGVNVVIKGATTGTITDIDGNYRIEVPPNSTLIFSFVGFKEIERTVSVQSVIDIQLSLDVTELSEVVITAYGTSKKSAFTGSAVQIDAAKIEKRSVANFSNLLEGTAGVQFNSSSGQPGASSGIRIRGTSSVNISNNPLIVLDGIIFSGSFNSINPNDIESISVLKDAASTALYGSKAANGVIIITSKGSRGDNAKFSVSFNQGFTSRFIPEYERVSSEQYYPLLWESLRNSFLTTTNLTRDEANQRATDEIFGELRTNPFNVDNGAIVLPDGRLNPAASLLYNDDWQDELSRQGTRRNVNLSYQGGSDKTSFFGSLSYLDEEGWVINSDFQRFTGRLNVNVQPKDWVKVGINLGGTTSTGNQSNDNGSNSFVNPFFSTRFIAPIYPVFERDPTTGEFVLDAQGNRQFDLGENRVGNTNGRNVIQESLLNRDVDRIFSISTRSYIDFYFLKDFKFTANVGLDQRFFTVENFDNAIVGDGAPAGRAFRTDDSRLTLSLNQLLNYTKDIGDHTISGLVGHESLEFTRRNNFSGRMGVILDGNEELANFTDLTDGTTFLDEYATESFFSRVEYDYKDRYFLSGSFRRDGSSRFNGDVRWGGFASIGAAWRLDQETFIQSPTWVDALKLRSSYGSVGNDSNFNTPVNGVGGLSFFASQGLFNIRNNASEAGINAATLPAVELEWETNTQFDVAVEYTLFKNRLFGTLEWYRRETDGLIFDNPLALSTGFQSINENIGTMFNRGFEFEATVAIVRNQDFQWNFSINASTIQNKFTEIPGEEEIINGLRRFAVDGSQFDIYTREWFGVDPADGSGLFVLDPEQEVVEGDETIRTVDGTLVTTDRNKANFAVVGNSLPDLFGSFNSSFGYKNFNLQLLFTYQLGGDIYDVNYIGLNSPGNFGDALHVDVLNRWQQPGDITDVPRLDESQNGIFDTASSRWITNADFIALRQVNLSYDLPTGLLSKLDLSSIRVYGNVENVFLSATRKGLDVSQDLDGIGANRFSPSRVFTLGITASF